MASLLPLYQSTVSAVRRNPPKPVLNLTPSEKSYWEVLNQLRLTQWDSEENYLACQLCRDFAMLEKVCILETAKRLTISLLQRCYYAVKALNFDANSMRNPDESVQHKLIHECLIANPHGEETNAG